MATIQTINPLTNYRQPWPRQEDRDAIEMREMAMVTSIVNDDNDDDEDDMKDIWKSVEAPQASFTFDDSKFYFPEGPLEHDSFSILLDHGEIAAFDKQGLRLNDAERHVKIKIKKRQEAVTFASGCWILDYHPRQAPLKCVLGRGAAGEASMTRRLQTECRAARERVAKSMACLLWYRVQGYGSLPQRLPRQVADCLGKTATALSDLADSAARFIETMKQRYQEEGGRQGQRRGRPVEASSMPAWFRSLVRLLGLVRWHRVHRAANSARCLEKAFRRRSCGNVRTEMLASSYIGQSVPGVMGWRGGPESPGVQGGVLADVLQSLAVLCEVDWRSFDAKDVEARMSRRSTPVRIVRDCEFCSWTFEKTVSVLVDGPLEYEVWGSWCYPGPSQIRGHIQTMHLEMLRNLPWAEVIGTSDDVEVRLAPC